MDFRIRRAEQTDVAEMAACLAAAYAPARAEGVSLPPVSEGLDEDIRDHLVWVAVSDRIIGGVVLGITGDVAHLINIAVHPSSGGTGVGRDLLDTALDEARRRGALRIDLATHVDMPANADMYRHLGWEETGRDQTRVFMSRSL